MKKDQSLSQTMKNMKKDCCKVFEQTQTSSPIEYALVFLRCEKFLPRSDGELTEQLLTCSVPIRCDEDQIPSTHHSIYGGH